MRRGSAGTVPQVGLVQVVVLLLLGCLASCSSGDEGGPRPTTQPQLALAVTQLLPRQGTRQVLLRVTNETTAPVSITGVGMRWDGYGGRFLRAEDAEVPPEGTLDVSMTVPPERCRDGAGRPLGLVDTTQGLVEQPLTASGEDYLRRMWERRCFEQTLDSQVSVSYGERWVLDRERMVLDGHLAVERLTAGDPLTFTRAIGSVLHEVTLPRPVLVPPSAGTARVPVQVQPGNRCDEHAIGQATAPFTFRYGVEIGDAAEQVLQLVPPPALQGRINALLRLHCAQGGR